MEKNVILSLEGNLKRTLEVDDDPIHLMFDEMFPDIAVLTSGVGILQKNIISWSSTVIRYSGS